METISAFRFVFIDSLIERSVTSRYRGNKISASQN